MNDPDLARVAVVYESMFGNTADLADAIGDALRDAGATTTVYDVTSAPRRLDGFDLVVVGAPTHAFGMSRRTTRRSARDQGASGDEVLGIREWLDELDPPTTAVVAECFDTRVRKPLLPGSAARAIRRRLRRLGFSVGRPVSFAVTGTPGPLADGELARARTWAAGLISQVTCSSA